MRIIKVTLGLMTIFAISACGGGVQKTLGLSKSSPDEFMVYSKPPLSVPPDFSLRAPEAAGQSFKDSSLREEARDRVFTGDKPASSINKNSSTSKGEGVLLQKAGGSPNEDRIRELLQEDVAIKVEEKEEKGTFGKIISKLNPTEVDSVVDAEKEKERLDENDKQGKSPTDGETPVIKPNKDGLINRIIQ